MCAKVKYTVTMGAKVDSASANLEKKFISAFSKFWNTLYYWSISRQHLANRYLFSLFLTPRPLSKRQTYGKSREMNDR
uniref:Uncharacterized protein n=1 Tax=Romanomermis culicivorax TaxID=13658 RepID=A0A915JUC1_ROMCU